MDVDFATATIDGQLAPMHPGRVLKINVLPRLRLTMSTVSERLGLSRRQLASVLEGSAAIDAPLAGKIAELVGGTPEIWLRMQKNFELAHDEPAPPRAPGQP